MIAVILKLEQVLSQNVYGDIGNVALRAVRSIVIVVADSHRCGGWIKELGPIDAYSTRLTVFGEWCWIAIVAARGHSRLGISFLEMKFRKSSGSPDGHVWGGAPDSHVCGCSLEVARRIVMFAVAHLRLLTG